MPWWASLYIAFLLMSLPFGLVTIHRLEQDLLHPVGGMLSTLVLTLLVLPVVFFVYKNISEIKTSH